MSAPGQFVQVAIAITAGSFGGLTERIVALDDSGGVWQYSKDLFAPDGGYWVQMSTARR